MKKTKILLLILSVLILLSILFYVTKNNETDSDTSAERSGKEADLVIPKAGNELKGYTIIMHTNDTHGRVSPDASKGQMGFTAVSALKKCYEAAGAKIILLDAGDTLHGTDFASKNNGKRIIEVMNLVGYDAMVPGNNDFNYGPDALLKNVTRMDYPLISSNITYQSNGELLLQDHILIEKNGIKYGIFGLTTTDTVIKEDPHDIKALNFDNPVTSANKEVKELKAEGAKVIIALAHLGVDDNSKYTSKDVALQVKGIDLIVDGHSHTELKNGLKEGNTLIVSAGEYLENIGVVTIDPKGKMRAQLVKLSEFSSTDPDIDQLIDSYKNKKNK